MSKIKTADCVKALVEKYGIPANWKRRTKIQWGNGIKRIFEDTLTNKMCTVYEENDAIVSITPTLPCEIGAVTPKEIVAVPPIYYVIHEAEGSIGLTVTDSKHFDTKHCQSDWTPKGTFEELKRLGFPGCEAMEGVVEFFNEVTNIEVLKAKLASSSVFKFSKDFQAFLSEFSSEEFNVIPI